MAEHSSPTTYVQTLSQAGLTADQAQIYEVLIKNGPLPAGKIYQKTPFKRGLVYKLLDQLEEIGLVLKKGKPTIFEPAHPLKLKELAEKKEEEAKTAQIALSGVIDTLTSEFNLAVGKPGVQFYEGLDGVKKVAIDTLSAKTVVLQYVDVEVLDKNLPQETDFFTKKRVSLRIKKQMLIRNSEYAKNLQLTDNDHSEHKYFQSENPLNTVTYIYDDKIALVTLEHERLLGIIITNAIIANTQREIFNALWEQSINEPLDIKKTPPT